MSSKDWHMAWKLAKMSSSRFRRDILDWNEPTFVKIHDVIWTCLKTFTVTENICIYIYNIYSAISLTRCGLQCIATGSALNDLRSFRMLQAARCFVWTQRYSFHIIQKKSEFYVTIFMAVRLSTIHMIHWYGFWQSLVWRRRFRPFHSKMLQQTKWRWHSMLTLRGHRGSLMNELLSAALSGLSASSR